MKFYFFLNFRTALFVTNIAFLSIYLPWSIVVVIYHINDSFFLYPDLIASNGFQAALQIANAIGFINNMTCFFINFSFNHLFRFEFWRTFGAKGASESAASTFSAPRQSTYYKPNNWYLIKSIYFILQHNIFE